jgi:ubiquinone/menaquinone biosynthesis C-methylase UbiE
MSLQTQSNGESLEGAPGLSAAHSFWTDEACRSPFFEGTPDSRELFERFREFRYRSEWHIPLLIPFADAKGKKVLEIGLGNGADGVMFALNGADYTGVDLTETALNATRRHFAFMGLKGTFQRESAEQLSFPGETFDWVYSHGVLHHTPDTQRAIDEVRRILKPGGRAIIMLYHKHSFNYFVRIMGYMRSRLLIRILSRMGRWKSDRERITSALHAPRGNQDRDLWNVHYQNFLTQGWSYLAAKEFVHHCADGPECPVAYAFSKAETRKLFSRFHDVRTTVAHFPVRQYLPATPMALERVLARTMGWYLFIFARK